MLYTQAVEDFSFPRFVDGSLLRHSEKMNIVGAQRARRKRDWLEVQIGIPESWWREGEAAYKNRLVAAMEEGLHSMIALLRRNRHEVNAESLFADWQAVKAEFLATPAPPFAAEKQRARMMSVVEDAIRKMKEGRKA